MEVCKPFYADSWGKQQLIGIANTAHSLRGGKDCYPLYWNAVLQFRAFLKLNTCDTNPTKNRDQIAKQNKKERTIVRTWFGGCFLRSYHSSQHFALHTAIWKPTFLQALLLNTEVKQYKYSTRTVLYRQSGIFRFDLLYTSQAFLRTVRPIINRLFPNYQGKHIL